MRPILGTFDEMQAGSSNKQLMDPYFTAGTPALPAQGPVWVEEAAIKITQGKMKEPGPMEWKQGVSYIICLERRQMLTNQVGEGRGGEGGLAWCLPVSTIVILKLPVLHHYRPCSLERQM